MIKEFAHKSDSCSKDLIGKDTLLHEAKLMCSIADGLIRFVNIKHPELLINERKKHSLFFLKNALLRMDSCIVLLEKGSSLLKCKDGSTYINPFSILTLIRSIYESLVVHYYYILVPNEEYVSDFLIRLWKMSGIKNRLVPEAYDLHFDDKYRNDSEWFSQNSNYILKSEIYEKASKNDRSIIKRAMVALTLLKISKKDNEYKINKTSYEKAGSEIFAGTSFEPRALIVYKLFSAISHPSYLNCIQTNAHEGSYNLYTENAFEGGIIYLKKLIDNVLQVIPEGQEYLDSQPTEIKQWFNSWEIK